MSIAANGHVTLDFGDYDSFSYQQACAKLETELGFTRRGGTVAGMDEGESPFAEASSDPPADAA